MSSVELDRYAHTLRLQDDSLFFYASGAELELDLSDLAQPQLTVAPRRPPVVRLLWPL